jgi:tetratricopeptide (TPR) repeat protein
MTRRPPRRFEVDMQQSVRRCFWILLCLAFSNFSCFAEGIELAEALQMAKRVNPAVDVPAASKSFFELVQRVKAAMQYTRTGTERLTAEQTIQVLSVVILQSPEMDYCSNIYWRDSIVTAALQGRKGNCLATSLLYYLVGRELNLPISLAFAPGHIFVRWDEGGEIYNIETTRWGETFSDREGRKLFELDRKDLKPNGYMMRLSPDEQRARVLISWSGTLYALERRDEARKMLAEADALSPNNVKVILQRAFYDLIDGNVGASESALKGLLARRKELGPWARATVDLAYSRHLMATGRIDESLKFLSATVQDEAPKDKRVEIADQLGELYRHKRNYTEALSLHELAADTQPSEDYFISLACVLIEMKRDKDAVAACEKALKRNPESAYTKVLLAGLYERGGDAAKGRALFAQIVTPRDNMIGWHCVLAWYYATVKDPDRMLYNMASAFRIDHSGHTYYYFLREPDLDAYRQQPRFAELMLKNKPHTAPAVPAAAQ